MKNKVDMVNGPLLKNIIRFSVPVILTGILQLLFNACDMVVVGSYAGSNALAAVGSTTSLTNLFVNTFMGLSIGANVITAYSLGAKEEKRTEKIVHTAVTISVLCGVLLAIIGVIGCEWCLEAMGSPEEVLHLSVLYMRIYFLGLPAMMLYNFCAAILRAQGKTIQPLIFLSIAGVVNVVLNLLLVVKFQMSVAGVAIGTIASQVVSAILIVMYLMKVDGPCRLKLKKLGIDKNVLGNIFRIGIPAGINSMVFSFANIQIQSAINMFGASAMAGSTAAASLEGFVYTSMNAIHQAAINFTGQNVGAAKEERVPKILKTCILCVSAVGIVLGAFVYGFGEDLLSLYTDSGEDIRYGMIRLKLVVIPYLVCGQMEVILGVIRGLGYSIMPTIVSLIGACGLRILWIATIFKMMPSLEMLFITYPISWLITTVAHFICYTIVTKKG
ncbi:MAG: MATE family efflux transporter [Lachnospiraceae bacterium]|nr:MATE family efflux transporter [Lachnospiraceae bacterium]